MPIISLSLIPGRFSKTHLALNSLLAQNVPDTKVEVYIPKRYRRFPDYDGRLPEVPKGVEICIVEDDLGPATKVLYAAEKYKNESVDILFCDDDRIYFPNWAEGFMQARAKRPDDAIVASGLQFDALNLPEYAGMKQPRALAAIRALDFRRHFGRVLKSIQYGGANNVPTEEKPTFRKFRRAGYVAIGEGCGGFMVKPQFFDKSIWDIPPILWAVDDVWLSGHLDRQGIGIWAMAGSSRFKSSALENLDALHQSVIDGVGRGAANLACVAYMQKTYGVWGGGKV